jgi:uncharacterized membrane protein YjjP (DUF1212 family)
VVHEEAADDPASAELRAAFGFAVRLGRALLSFGLPAQRLEEALQRVAHALGFEMDCFSTPTSLIITFSDGVRRRTRVVRVEPGETNLERLTALHQLVGRVERRELSPADASRRLEVILARKRRYSDVVVTGCYGLSSAAASVVLGGGVASILPALGLGLVVGLIARAARSAPTLARILPAFVAMVATVLARLVHLTGVPVGESVLVLSSLIVLLPGFTLTIATMELATANVVSGTARLVGGFATLVQLGFGVLLGVRLAMLLPDLGVAPIAPTPEWILWAAYGVGVLGFSVLLEAPPRDFGPILVTALVAIAGARLGRLWLGPEIGAFLGATLVGLASHAYARLRDRPALLLLTPAILLLVPGSVGFLSIASMLDADVVTALRTAFRMILIATALAAGVLVATVAVPPRRAL